MTLLRSNYLKKKERKTDRKTERKKEEEEAEHLSQNNVEFSTAKVVMFSYFGF